MEQTHNKLIFGEKMPIRVIKHILKVPGNPPCARSGIQDGVQNDHYAVFLSLLLYFAN